MPLLAGVTGAVRAAGLQLGAGLLVEESRDTEVEVEAEPELLKNGFCLQALVRISIQVRTSCLLSEENWYTRSGVERLKVNT